MSFEIGTTPLTTTPAADFYTNTLAPALTAASWTLRDTITDNAVHNLGATVNAYVWENPTAACYVSISYDTAAGTTGLAFRLSEEFDYTTDHKLIRPCAGNNTYAATAVGADGSNGNGTEYQLGTATTVGSVSISVPLGTTQYILGVTGDYIVCSTRVNAINYWVYAGQFTDLQTYTGTIPALLLAGQPISGISWNQSSSTNRVTGKTSRDPGGVGLGAFYGTWGVNIDYPFPTYMNTGYAAAVYMDSGLGCVYGTFYGAYHSTTYGYSSQTHGRNHSGPVVATATLHNVAYGINTPATTTTPGYNTALRGYLPDFIVGFVSNYNSSLNTYQSEPPVGYTISAGGSTYYAVGACNLEYSSNANGMICLFVNGAI